MPSYIVYVVAPKLEGGLKKPPPSTKETLFLLRTTEYEIDFTHAKKKVINELEYRSH